MHRSSVGQGGGRAYGTFRNVGNRNSRSADPSQREVKSLDLGGWKRALGRPVLDARPPLRHDWWGKARGCPSPACLQRSWWSPAPDFVLWLDPPFGANGAGRHIWQRSMPTNRICTTVASVDYFHAGMARGSQRVGPQALQLVRFRRTPDPICSQGVRCYLSVQASVNTP